MTNKQIDILNKIIDIAKNVTGIAYAGLYPESIDSIGQRYPAVVVQDGNEASPNYMPGQTLWYDYEVDVILHHELSLLHRIDEALDLQNKLITAITTDLSLGFDCVSIIGHNVDKGSRQNALIDNSAGYQGEITSRVITFTITVRDTRVNA